MKYLIFDKSAIEHIIGRTEFQSTEFQIGKSFIDFICGNTASFTVDELFVKKIKNGGILFSGSNYDFKHILVFDLVQSGILYKEKNEDDLLLVFQKSFRTAIRIWNRYPFASSEKIHGSKSIIFPFVFTDHRRVVIERSVSVDRLTKRGVEWPLLAYKYGTDDAPRGEEIPNSGVLREAGEDFLDTLHEIRNYFLNSKQTHTCNAPYTPLVLANANQTVSDRGFRYLSYEQQLSKLTDTQRKVVENDSRTSPIRIDGPAGTGKTVSMLLRAYRLLSEARASNTPLKIAFFSHSESTDYEIQSAFSQLKDADYYVQKGSTQHIVFSSLYQYCIKLINVADGSIIERDAEDAKLSQRIYIEDALDKTIQTKYKTFRPLLSEGIQKLFDGNSTQKGILISMLQHEFGVQIKGRTDCTIEEYYKLEPISNALPAATPRDKDFVFTIFKEYQNMLQTSAVYDSDDITIQALSQLNAPFWRRERVTEGFDYIFVDEMHLFNINEQHVFHYLTKNVSQREITICFALDYGQAIGDRGDIAQDYVEKTFANANRSQFKTVFRSSQEITDFCASISAAGALMFQQDFRDPYNAPTSGFTQTEADLCEAPTLFMYPTDEIMEQSLKSHIDKIKRETLCSNKEIAVITFESDLLSNEAINRISQAIGKPIRVLKSRFSSENFSSDPRQDSVVFSEPHNINGLEFAGVILFGVDDGRVPQTKNVGDVSENYIKFIAFNQLYLSASRAKYRLVLLGNELHGTSPCLQYAIESKCLVIPQ